MPINEYVNPGPFNPDPAIGPAINNKQIVDRLHEAVAEINAAARSGAVNAPTKLWNEQDAAAGTTRLFGNQDAAAGTTRLWGDQDTGGQPPPLSPTTETWIPWSTGVGVPIVLPAGGRWAYAMTRYASPSFAYSSFIAGEMAGGSTVPGTATAGTLWVGFLWRKT